MAPHWGRGFRTRRAWLARAGFPILTYLYPYARSRFVPLVTGYHDDTQPAGSGPPGNSHVSKWSNVPRNISCLSVQSLGRHRCRCCVLSKVRQ